MATAQVFALGTATGCAHTVFEPAVLAVAGAARPDPGRLIDFYASPKAVVRDYQELQLITVLAWGRTQEEQIIELKERARAAGGDGVILLDESKTTGPSLNYSDSTCQTDSIQLRGVVIVYDLDAEDSVRTPAGR